MLKAVYPVLAVLALLFAAMGGGRNVALSGASVGVHVTSHDVTSIDDDESDDDDEPLGSSTLAPRCADEDDDRDDGNADGDGDGSALHPIAGAIEFPPLGVAASPTMRRRGLRPSGAHRAAADRPPRV